MATHWPDFFSPLEKNFATHQADRNHCQNFYFNNIDDEEEGNDNDRVIITDFEKTCHKADHSDDNSSDNDDPDYRETRFVRQQQQWPPSRRAEVPDQVQEADDNLQQTCGHVPASDDIDAVAAGSCLVLADETAPDKVHMVCEKVPLNVLLSSTFRSLP